MPIRGYSADEIVVDEAAFIDSLKTKVKFKKLKNISFIKRKETNERWLVITDDEGTEHVFINTAS